MAGTLQTPNPANLCNPQVGLVPLLELLLQNGARAGWADAAGRQPLHYAVLAGRTEAAKLLVSPCLPTVHARASCMRTSLVAVHLLGSCG